MDFSSLLSSLSENGVTLVAISKTKSPDEIMAVYNRGQRIFGENRAKELQDKHKLLPKDIEWHMVGHLQKNKVKYIGEFVDFIHSVDSIGLLKTIQKVAAKHNRTINILLQVKIAEEATKAGLDPSEIVDWIEAHQISEYPNVKLRGLMGMATFTDDLARVREEFKILKQVYDLIKDKYENEFKEFDTLSMGMSGDYEVAIEEGATMVRIGSLIFGARS